MVASTTMMVLLPVWYDNSTDNEISTNEINEHNKKGRVDLSLFFIRSRLIPCHSLDMTEENHSNKNKSPTEYDKIVQEFRNHLNTRAKDLIPRMYEALKQDGYDKDQAREKIEKDWLNVWTKKTIRDNLPSEVVREYKREMTSDIEDKNLLQVNTDGRQEVSRPNNDIPTKPVSNPTTVPSSDSGSDEHDYSFDVTTVQAAKIYQCARDGIRLILHTKGMYVVDVRDVRSKR